MKWNGINRGVHAKSCWNGRVNNGVNNFKKKISRKLSLVIKISGRQENWKNISECVNNYGNTYEKKIWKNDKNIEINSSGNGSGDAKFDEVRHVMCNKVCGGNKTIP